MRLLNLDYRYSIIIPVHNAFRYLKECLESLYRYTINFELLIWDNASDKETKEYLENMAKIKNNILLIRNEENIGFVKPCNRMAEKARGLYFVIANSDLAFCQNWAETLSGTLESDPKIGIAGRLGLCTCPDGQARLISKDGEIDYIEGSLMMIPRKVYEELGLFDENYIHSYVEDVDYSFKVRSAGYKIKAISLGVVHYHAKTREEVIKVKDLWSIELKNREYFKNKWKNHPLYPKT